MSFDREAQVQFHIKITTWPVPPGWSHLAIKYIIIYYKIFNTNIIIYYNIFNTNRLLYI